MFEFDEAKIRYFGRGLLTIARLNISYDADYNLQETLWSLLVAGSPTSFRRGQRSVSEVSALALDRERLGSISRVRKQGVALTANDIISLGVRPYDTPPIFPVADTFAVSTDGDCTFDAAKSFKADLY